MIHRNAQVRRFTTKKVVCCARERGTREPERENRETVAQNGQTKRQILKYLVSFSWRIIAPCWSCVSKEYSIQI